MNPKILATFVILKVVIALTLLPSSFAFGQTLFPIQHVQNEAAQQYQQQKQNPFYDQLPPTPSGMTTQDYLYIMQMMQQYMQLYGSNWQDKFYEDRQVIKIIEKDDDDDDDDDDNDNDRDHKKEWWKDKKDKDWWEKEKAAREDHRCEEPGTAGCGGGSNDDDDDENENGDGDSGDQSNNNNDDEQQSDQDDNDSNDDSSGNDDGDDSSGGDDGDSGGDSGDSDSGGDDGN